MENETLISLTSIPRRLISSTILVIDELKKQNVKCKILLNIPHEYKKWGKYILPPDLFTGDDQVIVYRPIKDYGPATKLMGALEYIETNLKYKYIITVDDDVYYDNYDAIGNLLINSQKHPKCAITYGGIKLVCYPYCYGNGLSYNNIGNVDIPAGYMGVLYPVEEFRSNNLIFNLMNELPEGIFNDDDAYFGIVLNAMKINLIALKKLAPVKLIKTSGGSAVVEQTTKHRTINEMEIFQYAVNNKLLLNN